MRLVLKACQRVGVEHEGAPRSPPTARLPLGAGFGATQGRVKRNGVIGVASSAEIPGAPRLAQHDARQCAGVTGIALRTRQRHSPARRQRGDSSQSRGAGERSAAGNDKRCPASMCPSTRGNGSPFSQKPER